MQKLNNISFTLGQGGSGRVANGSDYISGLLFYNNTRPSALLASLPGGVDNFSSGSVVQIYSPQDAFNLGINNLYSDETQSVSKVVITNAGATGDAITIKVADWIGGKGKGVVSLGTYINISSDIIETVVDGLVAAINAGTNVHGYTAADTGDTETTVFITAPKGKGIYFNSGSPYTQVLTGTMAATITQPTGSGSTVLGVASKLAVYYYHIQRYFAVKPDGTLYIGIFNVAGSGAFTDIDNMVNYSNNTLVQLGIWDDTQTYALASLTAIQARINILKTAHKLLSSCVYAADVKAIGAITLLAAGPYDLSTLNAQNTSALIDNDGNANGLDLFYATGKTISSLGACIGCISEAAISEDIGNSIDRFNADDGIEFDTLMFGDGTFYNSVLQNYLDSLNNNRYIFLSKIPFTTGSFYSDDHAAIAYTSDYAWIHDNRIIDRVIKDTFAALVPVLKSKLKLNTDGTMQNTTIIHLMSLVGDVLKPLIASEDLAGDIDNFDASNWVLIDPRQKVNTTGLLKIGVKLAENAIAHSISVPIGFGTV
jgi:hypothetical protein